MSSKKASSESISKFQSSEAERFTPPPNAEYASPKNEGHNIEPDVTKMKTDELIDYIRDKIQQTLSH